MKINTKTILKLIIVLILGLLLLVGGTGFFTSSLSQDEIRATAYHLATTQLATTQLVTTIVVTLVENPTHTSGVPTPTRDPILCAEDELTAWKAIVLDEFLLLDGELQILTSNDYDTSKLNTILDRANTQIISITEIPHPKCADDATRLFSKVYEHYSAILESIRSGSSSTNTLEWDNFIQAMSELFGEIEKLFSEKEYKEIRNIFSNY
jgi:hypothetical protein